MTTCVKLLRSSALPHNLHARLGVQPLGCSPGAGPEKAMIWSSERLAALPEMQAPAAPPVGAAGVVMLPLATAAFHCGQLDGGGDKRCILVW